MAKKLDADLEVNEFKLEWLNSITTVLLQGWLCREITHEGSYAIKQRNKT